MGRQLLRVTYGDRLLLLTGSAVEAQALFRQRQQLLHESQVRHLECWICSGDLQVITPVFTANLDETGQLRHDDPKTAAEHAWEEGWDEGDI